MTSKFDVRRGLLLGALGSGLAVVLASCASPYREPVILDDEPEPYYRRVRREPSHRRVIYRHRKMPAEPQSDTPPPSGGGGGGGGAGGGGGTGGGNGWSDRRLKTDIKAIGHSPSGLPIYQFRYVWGGPAYVGVMAQDLLEARPEAVILTDSGYYMVDYDRIDVKMTTLVDYKRSVQQISH